MIELHAELRQRGFKTTFSQHKRLAIEHIRRNFPFFQILTATFFLRSQSHEAGRGNLRCA